MRRRNRHRSERTPGGESVCIRSCDKYRARQPARATAKLGAGGPPETDGRIHCEKPRPVPPMRGSAGAPEDPPAALLLTLLPEVGGTRRPQGEASNAPGTPPPGEDGVPAHGEGGEPQGRRAVPRRPRGRGPGLRWADHAGSPPRRRGGASRGTGPARCASLPGRRFRPEPPRPLNLRWSEVGGSRTAGVDRICDGD